MNSDIKTTIKRIFQGLIFMLLFGVGLLGIYNVFKWKDTAGDYNSSMEQMYNLPDDIVDMAFFGPSVMYSGINPAILWKELGVASFNAAISGQDREAAYYYIKEFVKKQSPKVVFVTGMLFETDTYAIQGNLYRNTLSMRTSGNYKELVDAIVPDNDKTETNTVWDYYLRWPIIHNRYNEIKKNDFVPVKEYEKCLGYVYSFAGNGFPESPVYSDYSQVIEISPENKEWVDRLVKLSKEENFELVFVQIPGYLDANRRAMRNGDFKYLDELGIKHIDYNLCAAEMGFDYTNDMSDGFHPKTSGATKMTLWLCDYIKENFAYEDRRGQDGYELFDDALEVYNHEMLVRDLADCSDPAYFWDLVYGTDGLVCTVALKSGFDGITEEAADILNDYLPGLDALYAGGTAVLDDGKLSIVNEGEFYSLKLNDSDYLSIRSLTTEDGREDLIFFGQERRMSESGSPNFVIVYDKVLDRIVNIRDIN